MTSKLSIGIDVSKAHIDITILPGRKHLQIERTELAIDEWLSQLELGEGEDVLAVLEASGGYERLVMRRLAAAGTPLVLIEPARARAYARAMKRRAKTDRIDSGTLADMADGPARDERRWKPLGFEAGELRTLVDRRSQLVETREAERKRLATAIAEDYHAVIDDLKEVVAFLSTRVQQLSEQIDVAIERCPELRERATAIEAVSGIGPTTSATLLAHVPELGNVDRGQIAALVGVAPLTRESGDWIGQRFISGGRAVARKALYMAALAATRHNAVIREYYAGLLARGKKKKVALVACMRKLLIHLNGLLRVARTPLASLESNQPTP
jgi:transposase